MHTREQVYAQRVYELVSSVDVDPARRKAYGAMAHSLPVLIRTAGLVQALEFVHTRKAPQKQLLSDLAAVLGYNKDTDLLQASRRAHISEYMYLTQEALQALLWFKRYAQSVLDVTSE